MFNYFVPPQNTVGKKLKNADCVNGAFLTPLPPVFEGPSPDWLVMVDVDLVELPLVVSHCDVILDF